MTQSSLWQHEKHSSNYAELCNALYERELHVLATSDIHSLTTVQGRLKSLPHYIKRTAHLMTQANTPLSLDAQNASWSAKQTLKMPLAGQELDKVWAWYGKLKIQLGLVVPIALENRIVLDSIVRIDHNEQKFCTNVYGWFTADNIEQATAVPRLLKPTQKVMTAACTGHCWQAQGKDRPKMPSLRELLLSCDINWQNFKQPLSD